MKKSVQEQVQKEFPEFEAEVAGLSVEELNERLSTLAKHIAANEEAQEQDEELAASRAEASELAAPYRDARKMLRLKSRYLAALAIEKGSAK